MSLAYILYIVVLVLLIIHCLRTGRSTLWIFVIALIPMAGVIAYVLVEIVPELFGSRATRRAVRGMRKALDPGQELRRLEADARISGDVASRQRYADALTREGRPLEAVVIYREALTGLYESDPNLMLGLAQAQFASGAFSDARSTLDTLIARNPDFRSADGHLLYARALAAEGNQNKALEEFAALTKYYSGAEAPLRYAQVLRAAGRADDARRVLKELLDHARFAPRHYRKMQQQWLASAERELSTL